MYCNKYWLALDRTAAFPSTGGERETERGALQTAGMLLAALDLAVLTRPYDSLS
jgi:hypothetical protein